MIAPVFEKDVQNNKKKNTIKYRSFGISLNAIITFALHRQHIVNSGKGQIFFSNQN